MGVGAVHLRREQLPAVLGSLRGEQGLGEGEGEGVSVFWGGVTRKTDKTDETRFKVPINLFDYLEQR